MFLFGRKQTVLLFSLCLLFICSFTVFVQDWREVTPAELAMKTGKVESDADAESFSETATFTLPANFVIDEMPDAVSLETPFGNYHTNYAAKDGKLVFTRKLVMNRTTVPVEKYNSIKEFYSKILAAEQSPIVLLKK